MSKLERFYIEKNSGIHGRRYWNVMDRAYPDSILLHARPKDTAEEIILVLNHLDERGEFRLPPKDWSPIAITEYAEWPKQ